MSFLLFCLTCLWLLFAVVLSDGETKNKNILLFSLDDFGYNDIFLGLTSDGISKFLNDESIFLSSHYSGYEESASKSQLMTGISSYHSGLAELGVSSFGHGTIGGIPQSQKILAEYLKNSDSCSSSSSSSSSCYSTYYVGNWDLGYSMNSQLPNNRGFDYFYGSYTSENDIISKKSSLSQDSEKGDTNNNPLLIRDDETQYIDFWENNNGIDSNVASLKDSNSQYADKVVSILNDQDSSSSSFYMHVSFQGAKQYVSNENFEYDESIENECGNRNKNSKIYKMCKYVSHLKLQFEMIIDSLILNNLYENTLIVILSTNGGDLSLGSCNYPNRGGMNTLLNGNVQTIAYVSGGAVVDSPFFEFDKKEASSLFSIVDWVPTLLCYAGVLDSSILKYNEFDGVNQYNYLFFGNTDLQRDHIMLHISPWGHDNFGVISNMADIDTYTREWGWSDKDSDSDSDNVYLETLNEIAMIFYDNDGTLWKYFVIDDAFDNENKYGTLLESGNIEYNWCVVDNEAGSSESFVSNIDFSATYGVLSGLFEISHDISEQSNLLTTISQSDFDDLKEIIMEKADIYLNNEYNSFASQLFGSFDCFFDRKTIAAYPGTTGNDRWEPFISSIDEYNNILTSECGLTSEHPMRLVHSASAASSDEYSGEFTQVSDEIFGKLHNQERIGDNNENVFVITSEDIDAKMNEISSLSDARSKSNVVLTDETHVYANCFGLTNGYYYIQIDLDSSKPILQVYCSNEYMLIDYEFENEWQNYFTSWKQAHYMVASPIKTDVVNWQEWFLPDSGSIGYDYILSPQCDECEEESLFQTESKSTTYWENAVNSYCATNERGMPAGDAKWLSYTCRQSVYSGVRGQDTHTFEDFVLYAMFVDDWLSSDYNGIDKDVLLTGLSGGNVGKLGTCLTLKQASDNERFTSVHECEVTDEGNGNMPTLGTNGQYCVCSKKTAANRNRNKLLTSDEIAELEMKVSKDTKIDKNDNKNDKKTVHYLYQSDFVDGTYRIEEAGIYKIMEDIVFDYNSPDYENDFDYSANNVYTDDGDLYWYPKTSQKEKYPGAYGYHDAYLLGFFAGITIESDDVTIDLNEKTLSMDERYFYQQPFWSHIEIGSQAFVPGEGPSHFGATPTYVKNVEIKNGVLGLTSHHCIHGTAPEASLLQNVKLSNLVCKDFITHGIQLNGFNGLLIENVEIGPNANKQYLTVDYSQMRTLLPRFEYFADYYGDSESVRFGGKPNYDYIVENNLFDQVSLSNDRDYTLREILDEMILQMDMAFDYVTNRKSDNELYNEYGSSWLQSKRVFVADKQNGIPYGGVIYGLYLNYPSSGISGFYRNSDKSYNVEVNNLYIHDITHSSREEAYLLKSMRSIFALPIVARFWMGDTAVINFSDYDSGSNVAYYGTIVYDWLVAYYNILKNDVNNVEATNLLYFGDTALNWVSGDLTLTGQMLSVMYTLTCNGDPMFHSVKGIFGLRVSNVENALLEDIRVENLRELSPIGSDVCGEYEKSHDIQQQLPYLYGFTGNNIHGVSVIDSDVLFDGLQVHNLNSLTGNATGMTIYPRANVKFDSDDNKFSNIIGGSSFLYSDISYNSLHEDLTLPNQLPRACGIKQERFNRFESQIIVQSLSKNEGTNIEFECINGYVGCTDEAFSGWTDFTVADSDSDSDVSSCDKDAYNSEIAYGMKLLSQWPAINKNDNKLIYKSESKSDELMNEIFGLSKHLDDKQSGNVLNHASTSSSTSTSTNTHMIIIMASIVSIATLFIFISVMRSIYFGGENSPNSKFNEFKNEWNGYTPI